MLTLRKHRISRLEEFSDAVFGFALTRLVIATAPSHWFYGRWADRWRQAFAATLTPAARQATT